MVTSFINLTDPVIYQSFGGNEYWEKATFAAGDIVLKEGEDSQDFYYIFSGLVKIQKSLKDEWQTQKHLATLGTGDFFGEGALLSDKMRSATVTALTATTVLKLALPKFEALVLKDPQAAVGIILGIVKVINDRLQNMNERLVMLEHISALARKMNGNLAQVLPSVLHEVETVLHHQSLVLLSNAGELKYITSSITPDRLEIFSAAVPKVVEAFNGLNPSASFLDETRVYLSVRNLEGTLRGVLAAELCPRCQEEDLQILLTVAEQIGNLFE